ncbi:MAG: alpha/beta hydrolase [Planctomycetota bacterium]|nr:alpha/beta hydrolase [Planctomycetota bacterium]
MASQPWTNALLCLVLLAACRQVVEVDPAAALPMQLQERTLDIDGASVHLLDQGPSDGPVVLLLHGARFHSGTWQELGTLALLAGAGVRAVAVDMPGFGLSAESAAEPAAWLTAVCDALDLERVTLVAPSRSGAMAFPFLLEMPERCSGFVPIAPIARDTYADRLHLLRVPTLVVWGTADAYHPVSDARAMTAAIEGAQLLLLEGAGHAAYLDRPDEFHAGLLGLLGR